MAKRIIGKMNAETEIIDFPINNPPKDFREHFSKRTYNNKCVIVIPVYKNNLNELLQFEIDTLKNTYKLFDDKYDIVFIGGNSLNFNIYELIVGSKINYITFNDYYFSSRYGYSDLCLSSFFYEVFSDYDYMLISQTDSWIFYNGLDYWLGRGYDYIGSPYFLSEENNITVGNGGLSLRKIKKFIEVSGIENALKYKHSPEFYEDIYYTNMMRKFLTICPLEESFSFGRTFLPENSDFCYNNNYLLSKNKTPFGIHIPFYDERNISIIRTLCHIISDSYNHHLSLKEKTITVGFCSKVQNDNFRSYIYDLFEGHAYIIEKIGYTNINKAYNEILNESQTDDVILIHNDITFYDTEKYKERPYKLFKKLFDTTEYGVIGVIGDSEICVERVDWNNGDPIGHYIQGFKDKPDCYANVGFIKPYTFEVENCVSLDGMFIAVRKSRLSSFFDESNESFHMYDLDFALSNSINGTKVGITKAFLVRHASDGVHNDSYYEARKWFIDKWNQKLPHKVDRIFKKP